MWGLPTVFGGLIQGSGGWWGAGDEERAIGQLRVSEITISDDCGERASATQNACCL
jgi:hypothetical protein